MNDSNLFLPDFLKHLFRSPSLRKQINETASGVTRFNVSKKKMEKVIIPLPPMPVQEEIVRILDNFTELTAELTARKKQYAYYRDSLFEFGDGVEWKPLGEVVVPTSNIRWSETNKSYKYIDLTSVCREKNMIIETIEITKDVAPSRAQKIVLENDVIFATTRPTQQRLCLIDEKYSGEVASTGYCVLRANIAMVLPKWIYFHIASNNFKNYVEENQSGSAYPAISDTKVKDFKIPLPPLAEQKRIVGILDRFDKLCTDITEGLPAEIKARRQQYEYYRDRLLTFKEKKAANNG